MRINILQKLFRSSWFFRFVCAYVRQHSPKKSKPLRALPESVRNMNQNFFRPNRRLKLTSSWTAPIGRTCLTTQFRKNTKNAPLKSTEQPFTASESARRETQAFLQSLPIPQPTATVSSLNLTNILTAKRVSGLTSSFSTIIMPTQQT